MPPEVYLQFRKLPDERPALIVRHDGCTVLVIDPRTTKLASVAFCVDNLTVAENDAYRSAYGFPATDEAMPEHTCTTEPVDTYVPPSLRLIPPSLADLRPRTSLREQQPRGA